MTIKDVLEILLEEYGVSKQFIERKLDVSRVYLNQLAQGKKLGSKKMKRRVLELAQKYFEIEEVI